MGLGTHICISLVSNGAWHYLAGGCVGGTMRLQRGWKQEPAGPRAFRAKELWLLPVGEGGALEGLTAQMFQTPLWRE